ncbi:MAG: hypothetical protein CSA66_06270 [Proteobacteria bacterium]|nr:MAG: hypothetical protein CSA66_06270 [Pseudomonadota bacterium]
MYRHAIAAMVALLGLTSTGSSALAGGDTSGELTTWTITEGAEAVGTETLRLVQSDSGALFASGEHKVNRGKHKSHLKVFLQRAPDGTIAKYRRVTAGRKGKGLFAFARNGGLRIVGVKTGKKARDFSDALSRYAWDPEVWNHLAVAALRLDPAKARVEVAYFDVAAATKGKAIFVRQDVTKVTTKGDKLVEVVPWALQAGPGAPLTVYVSKDKRRKLVGVAGAHRKMLIKGWTWEKGAPAVEEPDSDEPQGDEARGDADGGVDPEAEEVGP